MFLHVMAHVKQIVQAIVVPHARMNVREHVKVVVATIVQEDVKKAAQQDAKPLVRANVQVNAKALAQEAAQAAVLEVVKGLALAIVDMGVAEDALVVLQPARIRVRLKPHKDVKDAVIHAKQAVEDNATGLVVALVINSVKVPV